jgi:hypothetical protein
MVQIMTDQDKPGGECVYDDTWLVVNIIIIKFAIPKLLPLPLLLLLLLPLNSGVFISNLG